MNKFSVHCITNNFPKLSSFLNNYSAPRFYTSLRENECKYFLNRTALGKCLPIYTLVKKRVTKTLIRRIDGDIKALKDDLVNELYFDPETISLVKDQREMEIKGDHLDKLKEYFYNKGF